MVATWAEKEMRNLGRLNSANIPSPRPLELRSHGKFRTKTQTCWSDPPGQKLANIILYKQYFSYLDGVHW